MYWIVSIIIMVIGFVYFLLTLDNIEDGKLTDIKWYKKIIYFWAVGPISWLVLSIMKLNEWITTESEGE